MSKFRVLDQAVDFYQCVQALEIKGNLKDQLNRAASSISLNLSEGNAKATVNEKRHFFQLAYGSLRECQTIFQLIQTSNRECLIKADHLGGALYKLLKSEIKPFS